jgi:hypothetical protein
VLGPAAYPDGPDAEAFYRTVLADLKKRFPGTVVGVTRRVEEARAFQAAGLQTFLLADKADAPEGVTVVASWTELAKRLP